MGEVLFSESPYSCVLLPPHYSTHCNQCLVQLLAPIPCRYCTQTRYCSGACRDTAWSQYHQYECGQLDLLHSVGIGKQLNVMLHTSYTLCLLQVTLQSGLSSVQGETTS